MSNDYFYLEQIRRYHLQFNRIFSTFRWKTGVTSSGFEELRTVPCLPAPGSRQVESILRDGKENGTNSIPQFATYIEDVRLVPERRQDPDYVRSINTSERKLDHTSGRYGESLGNQYTIESYMPVPYDFIMKCDLITSNINQKHQLMEQIMILFNPMIDLQTSDNPFDWTGLGVVELTNIDWTSKSMPIADDDFDITSMTFNVRAWLSPPSKVKKQTVIQEIITNIGQLDDMLEGWQPDGSYFEIGATTSQVITSPGDLRIKIESTSSQNTYNVKLLDNGQVDRAGNTFTWPTLLSEYGKYKLDNSQLIVIDEYDGLDTGDIRAAGTIALTDDNSILEWSVNPSSLPPLNARIPNIVAVIYPDKDHPGSEGFKPIEKGDRYIVMSPLYQGGAIWGNVFEDNQKIMYEIAATEGDIIEYDGLRWNVIFDAEKDIAEEIWSFNIASSDYIHFSKGRWTMTLEGEYNPGNWRLKL